MAAVAAAGPPASLAEALAISDEARVVTLPDAKIIHTNKAWAALTGYKFADAANHTSFFLQGEATEREVADELQRACEAGLPATVRLVNYAKDGDAFRNTLQCVPLKDGEGRLTHFCAVLRGEPASDVPRRERPPPRLSARADRGPTPPTAPASRTGSSSTAGSVSGSSGSGSDGDEPSGQPSARKRQRVTLAEALANQTDALLLTQPHAPYAITHVNGPWVEMCGYTLEEVEGLTNRVLQGPETDAKLLEELMASVRRGEPASAQLVNYKKGGARFVNQLQVVPVHSEDETQVEQFMALLREVDEEPPAPNTLL